MNNYKILYWVQGIKVLNIEAENEAEAKQIGKDLMKTDVDFGDLERVKYNQYELEQI